MIFYLKLLLDIILMDTLSSPTDFHLTLCTTYLTLCISVRQPITEVKAEWNVAADVWEIANILGIFAVSLNPIIIQNWIKKNASKVQNTLLKSNCEFEGLRKFKMILIVNMFKILST